ncbi:MULTISPECIES: integrase core domain-containing protein [unclassified Roseovarius]|uniref:integrase core domain-containing protein n=1 Tax=unclassified Roseovarius TaxID=2614913 RepID=UPI003531A32C
MPTKLSTLLSTGVPTLLQRPRHLPVRVPATYGMGHGARGIEDWRIDYNTKRPHSSLKQAPEKLGAPRPFANTQWAPPLELSNGSAPPRALLTPPSDATQKGK